MKLLVMGGTHHVGRAVAETALRRGDTVTTLNRGLSRPPTPGVEALVADRTDSGAVRRALGSREWDAVIDTWAWAPRAVRDSARLLAGRLMTHPEEMAAVTRKLDPARVADAPGNPATALVRFLADRSDDLVDADPAVIVGVLQAVLFMPMHRDRLASPDLYPKIVDLLVDLVADGLTAALVVAARGVPAPVVPAPVVPQYPRQL
jgi:NAD(P)-dependent dehydrogenase (short-subunit alcohol dehydrogenase family)